ncbi:MAG: DUF4279 domain-containing protein [Nitrospinae bacterium]|nr:DUF4279 domain-containing protein [Nitrospinota bacterium]
MRENETHAKLLITRFDCSHQDIYEIIGIPASRIWHKGDAISTSIRRHKNNGYVISGGLPQNATLEEWIDNVLNLIKPYKDNFKKLPNGVYIELSCCVYIYGDEPYIGLSKENIKLLAEINAAYDLDYYILQELEDDE